MNFKNIFENIFIEKYLITILYEYYLDMEQYVNMKGYKGYSSKDIINQNYKIHHIFTFSTNGIGNPSYIMYHDLYYENVYYFMLLCLHKKIPIFNEFKSSKNTCYITQKLQNIDVLDIINMCDKKILGFSMMNNN